MQLTSTVEQEIQNAVNTAVLPLQVVIAGLLTTVARMEEQLVELRISEAKMYNHNCGDGRMRAYKTVLFADGSDPVADHGLPPLASRRDLRAASGNTLNGYYGQYYPGVVMPDSNAKRMQDLARALGLDAITIVSLE